MFKDRFEALFGTSFLTPWLMTAEPEEGDDPPAGGGGDDKTPKGGGTGNRGLLADADEEDPAEGEDKTPKGDDKTPKSYKTKIGDTEHEVPAAFWDAKANDGKGGINVVALLKSHGDTKANHDRLANELAEAKKNGGAKPPEKPEGYLTADVLKDGLFLKPEGTVRMQDIKADDPGLVLMAQVAHKHGLSLAQFKGIVSDVMIGADGFLPEPLDTAAELAKLGGEKAIPQVRALKSWITNLHTGGILSADEYAHLIGVGQRAIGVTALNKIRTATGAKPIPLGEGGVDGVLPSKEEWYANKPPHTDTVAYEKWVKQGEDVFGTAPAGSSGTFGVPASSTSATTAKADDRPSNTRTRIGKGRK